MEVRVVPEQITQPCGRPGLMKAIIQDTYHPARQAGPEVGQTHLEQAAACPISGLAALQAVRDKGQRSPEASPSQLYSEEVRAAIGSLW